MEFKLQDLAVIASNVNYIPALGVAVNQALKARSKVEYDNAMKEATKIAIGYENINIVSPTDYGQSSYLAGMPLWQPLTLTNPDTNEELFLENAVVELSRTKNIVSTVVQGRDTSVDEFINNGDWEIGVSGMICVNEPRYPIDEVVEFQSFMDLNTSLKVTHEVMNKLGIDELVVTSQSIPKSPHWNIQTFQFNAKSTKPLPLIIDLKSTAPKF